MRVGKRSGEADLARNSRPDNGFLIRIGRSPKSHQFFHPTPLARQILSNSQAQFLTRNERADKGFLTRVGKADKSFLTRVGRSSNLNSQPPANQDKRQKSGSKAYFLTRVGRAGVATKRKSYFTRVGRSSKSIWAELNISIYLSICLTVPSWHRNGMKSLSPAQWSDNYNINMYE